MGKRHRGGNGAALPLPDDETGAERRGPGYLPSIKMPSKTFASDDTSASEKVCVYVTHTLCVCVYARALETGIRNPRRQIRDLRRPGLSDSYF